MRGSKNGSGAYLKRVASGWRGLLRQQNPPVTLPAILPKEIISNKK
jgi:hypothetical protein